VREEKRQKYMGPVPEIGYAKWGLKMG